MTKTVDASLTLTKEISLKKPEGIQEIPWQQTSSRRPGGDTSAVRIAYRSPATIVRKLKIQNGLIITVFLLESSGFKGTHSVV